MRLGNSNTDIKDVFKGCSSFDGTLEWNFPNLTIYEYKGESYPINLVGTGFFSGCSSLEQVIFKTSVLEIRDSAFKEIAPGAEVYLPEEVVDVYGSQAIVRTEAPFPKVILPDSVDEWLQKMKENNFVLEKKDFRNTSWEVLDASFSNKDVFWKDVAALMMTDEAMCSKVQIDGTVYPVPLDRRIVGFVYFTNGSTRSNGCWILKEPETGFRVIVR